MRRGDGVGEKGERRDREPRGRGGGGECEGEKRDIHTDRHLPIRNTWY